MKTFLETTSHITHPQNKVRLNTLTIGDFFFHDMALHQLLGGGQTPGRSLKYLSDGTVEVVHIDDIEVIMLDIVSIVAGQYEE